MVNKAKFERNNLIHHRVALGLFFFIFLFSVYMFLVGHNAPGGGFISGLMSAIAIVLLYITFASHFKTGVVLPFFKYCIALGLFFAVGCGLGAIAFGYPFLTQAFEYFQVPFFGEIELATALIFDLGVYLTVVGAVLVIVISIGNHGHENEH